MRIQSLIRVGCAALLLVVTCNVSAMAQVDDDLREKFQSAQELVEQEDFAEAARIFQEITESNEEFGPGWFFLGYALHMDGQLDEAMKAHVRAAEFADFEGIATYNLACAHALKGNRDTALETLQKAVDNGFDDIGQIEFDSDLYSLHNDFRFAKMLCELGGDEELAEKMSEAEALVGNQEFAEAAEIYRAVLEEDKRNAFATYRLGYCLHGAGDLEAALEMHTRATKFKGVAPVATYNIACVHSLQGNTAEALDFLEKAVELGMTRLDAFEEDPDLENLREEDRFKELVAKVREMHEHHHGDHDHDHDDNHDHDDHDDHDHDHDHHKKKDGV